MEHSTDKGSIFFKVLSGDIHFIALFIEQWKFVL